MPLIAPPDLGTHIYAEIIAEITRNDDTIIYQAIAAAESEARLYLSRYDLTQLFGTADTQPAMQDPLLQRLLKDIALWHIIRLSSTGIDHAVHRTAYEDAIKILKDIMAGKAEPAGWPYLDTSLQSATPAGDAITWASNPKRNNYY